jgi:hypothetical protein
LTEVEALIARLRAALIFIGPDEITPMGKRILEKILDEASTK